MDQTREFLRRFQVPENAAEKALEYYRLAEMKRSTGLGLLISPTALSIICIKIACVQLGEPFDKVPHLFQGRLGTVPVSGNWNVGYQYVIGEHS